MNTDTANTKDVAAWMRAKSRRLMQMADELEQMFTSSHPAGHALPNGNTPTARFPRVAQVTQTLKGLAAPEDPLAQQIMGVLLNGRTSRAAEIAATIGAEKMVVQRTVDQHPEFFEVADRGWIKLRSNGQGSEPITGKEDLAM